MEEDEAALPPPKTKLNQVSKKVLAREMSPEENETRETRRSILEEDKGEREWESGHKVLSRTANISLLRKDLSEIESELDSKSDQREIYDP